MAVNPSPKSVAASETELRTLIDDLSNQLCVAVDGEFDFNVRTDVHDETLEKLQILINFVLDTARRALDRQRETQAHLAQIEKMACLGKLVAGVTHEVNTPLGAIKSANDTLCRAAEKMKAILDDGQARPQQKELLSLLRVIEGSGAVVDDGSERIVTIVKKLRSFARLDEAELKSADIHQGLDDTLALLRHELEDRIQVKRNYDELPRVRCYPGRLNQVFLNILMNATHAIEGEGEITIATRQEGNEIHVVIADDGIGIPPGFIDKLFDPGFTTKGVGVGTGLGLAISYQIVEEHGGRISVESTPGKGSTFCIALPIHPCHHLRK
jgi:signal transduction histidine kinase